ncbi:MAG: glycosyltransferase family 1 protein, partial [Bacteroidales bacterium]|nr:glycosyltransferase family 1 protein [Bacteroidales bacterium]
MKIGFDAKRLYCNFTGLGNYSRTLVKNLNEFHPVHDYYLYTPKIRQSPETRLFLNESGYKTRMPGTPFKSYWRTCSVKKQLSCDGIQIFHGLSNEIPFNIHKTGIKSVVTIHDLIFRHYPETYKPFDRWMYDLKFRYACGHADRIIAISESTKRDIIQFYGTGPDKIEVIYQACDPIYYQLSDPENISRIVQPYNLPADYLLSVGSVEPRKNLKRVIESYGHLKKDLQVPLVVIGKGGKYKQEVKEMISKARLEDKVIWINGLSDNHDLHALYQGARALIYPSYSEGFGLPVAEALLSKTPVITSGRSSMPEAGGPGSLYVDPDNTEQIASAIEKILTNSTFVTGMIEAGYRYAHETFGAEKVTGEVLGCYGRVL